MNRIRPRLTYANVMSSLAVFLVLGGGAAVAAKQVLPRNSVGAKQLKRNSVTTAKLKRNAVRTGKIGKQAVRTGKLATWAVRTGKIAPGAVTRDKLANGAVDATKLADGSVTGAKLSDGTISPSKLDQAARVEAYVKETAALTPGLSTPLIGSYGESQSVLNLELPNGLFVIHAKAEFVNGNVAEERVGACRLIDDGTSLDGASATLNAQMTVGSGTANLLGISDGGRIDLACRASGDMTYALERKIVAIRVASVE